MGRRRSSSAQINWSLACIISAPLLMLSGCLVAPLVAAVSSGSTGASVGLATSAFGVAAGLIGLALAVTAPPDRPDDGTFCLSCDYDLTACASEQCPECGTARPPLEPI